MAKRVKPLFLLQPHDLGSILDIVALLFTWIRRFTMIIFCLMA